MHNNRSRPSWSVPRARIEGEELGTFNNLVGSSNAAIGRPANHEDSLSDALEGPAADEWSFREPNHSNGVIINRQYVNLTLNMVEKFFQ